MLFSGYSSKNLEAPNSRDKNFSCIQNSSSLLNTVDTANNTTTKSTISKVLFGCLFVRKWHLGLIWNHTFCPFLIHGLGLSKVILPPVHTYYKHMHVHTLFCLGNIHPSEPTEAHFKWKSIKTMETTILLMEAFQTAT